MTDSITPRILVVDDDRSIRKFVSTLLSNEGYQVDVAANGVEALACVGARHYSLAVLDYQMPGMNGVELFRQICLSQPKVIGVLLTAYPQINTVFPAIEATIERVLAKPVNAQELLLLINRFLGKPPVSED